VLGPPTEAPEVSEDVLYDGQVASHAVEALRAVREKPFFLAVGFLKPHLPFVAPKKYWDLYEPGAIKVTDDPLPPRNAPPCAFQDSLHLRRYYGVPDRGPISEELRKRLIHGYYACVSFVDAQIGRVLDELHRLGLRESTTVILWGDHGWHLGEHGMWGKATNFERSVRAPLILAVPGMKNAGEKTDGLVEFVDIYPTMCELAGLPVPEGLEGTSFTPLLEAPDRRWKSAAFSQYRRRGVVGRSMRTDRYRLTCWFPRNKSEKIAIELYDYQTDPAETENLAGRPEHAELVRRLRDQLKAGWRAAKPPQ
jgi:arylsulfatase A-like enzyme